jgi:predicted nuclease of predicted toxin-antitoxin system
MDLIDMNISAAIFLSFLSIGIVFIIVYLNMRPYKKADMLINNWAKENNYMILKKEKRKSYKWLCEKW